MKFRNIKKETYEIEGIARSRNYCITLTAIILIGSNSCIHENTRLFIQMANIRMISAYEIIYQQEFQN